MSADNPETKTGFPEAYVRFADLFNRGLYWESHEALEGAWRENLSTFYKGLIIYASAFVHAQRGNPRGVYKQLVKARGYLNDYRPSYMGIDVDGLLDRLRSCLEVVEGADPPEGSRLTEAMPFHTLELSDDRVAGDEPELSGHRTPNPPPYQSD